MATHLEASTKPHLGIPSLGDPVYNWETSDSRKKKDKKIIL